MKYGLAAALALAAVLTAPAQTFPDSVYTPLWNYNGTWKVSIQGQTAARHSHQPLRPYRPLFFACEQNVNGNPAALVVFVPIDAEGHYKTNPITKDGAAIGPGDLEIKGNHWTYLGKSEENGKTTWYRTTNDFTDDSHIHFEQSQSTDKINWQLQRTGDEVRTDRGTK